MATVMMPSGTIAASGMTTRGLGSDPDALYFLLCARGRFLLRCSLPHPFPWRLVKHDLAHVEQARASAQRESTPSGYVSSSLSGTRGERT